MRKHVKRDVLAKGCSIFAALTLVVSMVPSTALATVTERSGAASAQVAAAAADSGAEESVQGLAAAASTQPSGYGLTYVVNSTATTWDGATIDISWYNTTATEFHITSAAQLIGLSAITSPLRGTLESDLPTDAAGNYTLDGVASNAVYADGSPIYVDTFDGKTVYLDCDLDIAGGTSSSSTCDWWKPISDCNVYCATAGGQGASISGSFGCVQWKGVFDGQGHTVSNLYVNGMKNTLLQNNFGGYQGMFTQIGTGAVIENVGTTGYLMGRVAGGICAESADSDYVVGASMMEWPRIQNCWSSATNVNNGSGSRMSGGIFGAQDAYTVFCNVINCYSSSALSGGESRAGIAGAANGVVAGSYFTGTVTSEGSNYTGAVVGTLYLQGSTCDNVTDLGCGAYVNNLALTSSTSNNGYSYRYIASGSTQPTGSTEGLVSEDELKASAGTLGDAYVEDTDNVNGGYPILFCQAGLSTIDLSSATVAPIADQQYTAKKITPDLEVTLDGKTLTYGTDYLVDFQNNVKGDADGNAQATVFGVGRYTGVLETVNFHIEAAGLSTTTIAAIPNQWRYPGDEDSSVTPTLFVEDANGNALTEGTDYRVEYSNNDAAGVGTATILPVEGSMTTGSNSVEYVIVDASASLAGSGTEADPYQVASKYDLQLLSHKVLVQDEAYLGAYYLVTQDIDARKTARTLTDPEVSPIGFYGFLMHDPTTGESTGGAATNSPFYGVFDGGDHTITLNMTSAAFDSLDLREASPYASTYLALFGVVGNADKTYTTETTIKNLTVAGSVTVNGAGTAAAGVLGYSYYGKLAMENVTNKATVSAETDAGELIGGATSTPTSSMAGICYEATIAAFDNCRNEGAIASNATSYVAGILGYAYGSSTGDLLKAPITITNCTNTGDITSSYATAGTGAGILAYTAGYSDITISKCANTGAVATAAYPAGIMSSTASGAFAKGNSILIDQCYNTGDITGTSSYGAAGILARTGNYTYTVTNCYNTGDIAGYTNPGSSTSSVNGYAGGIVGMAYCSSTTTGVFTVDNCYNVGALSGTYCGDLTGQLQNSTTAAKRGTLMFGGYGTSGSTYAFRATTSSAATESALIANGNIANTAQQVTADDMKGASVLAGLGGNFKADGTGECSVNDGYPVLAWQELPEPAPGLDVTCTDGAADKGEKATVQASVSEPVEGLVYRFYYYDTATAAWKQAAVSKAGTASITANATNVARQWKVIAYAPDGTTGEASFSISINDPVVAASTIPGAKYNAKATVNVSVSGYGTYGPAKYKYYYSADNGVTWKQVAYHNRQYTDTDSLEVTANATNAKRLWKVVVTFKDSRTAEAPFTVSYGK